jgi:hypothetical protein
MVEVPQRPVWRVQQVAAEVVTATLLRWLLWRPVPVPEPQEPPEEAVV